MIITHIIIIVLALYSVILAIEGIMYAKNNEKEMMGYCAPLCTFITILGYAGFAILWVIAQDFHIFSFMLNAKVNDFDMCNFSILILLGSITYNWVYEKLNFFRYSKCFLATVLLVALVCFYW